MQVTCNVNVIFVKVPFAVLPTASSSLGYEHANESEQHYKAHAYSVPAVDINAANGGGLAWCLA